MTRRPALLAAAAQASYELELAQAKRDQAIRAAFHAGATTREIAAEVGLSHSRVWQLVKHGRARTYPVDLTPPEARASRKV